VFRPRDSCLDRPHLFELKQLPVGRPEQEKPLALGIKPPHLSFAVRDRSLDLLGIELH
jgi:hypothetical protein